MSANDADCRSPVLYSRKARPSRGAEVAGGPLCDCAFSLGEEPWLREKIYIYFYFIFFLFPSTVLQHNRVVKSERGI